MLKENNADGEAKNQNKIFQNEVYLFCFFLQMLSV